jgi:hypothetical protein
MPNPNVDFTTGQTLLASQQNRFPRGLMAQAQSTVNYTLTAANAIATGMSVSFTGVAGRVYKFTYYEPAVETSTIAAGSTTVLNIRQTNAAGVQITNGVVASQVAGLKDVNALCLVAIIPIITSGAYTYVGCAIANSTTGAPILGRSATSPSLLLVEDIGLV